MPSDFPAEETNALERWQRSWMHRLTHRFGHRAVFIGIVAMAWLAVVTGLVALVSELLDKGWDASIAASSLALLAGQLTLGRSGRAPGPSRVRR